VILRELRREEVEQIWSIDRSEVIENVYHHEDDQLVLRPERHDVKGWPAGEPEESDPWLLDCFDRGGTFYGAYEQGRLVGIAVLESRFIGRGRDQLQLKFLHVDRSCRRMGIGRRLFDLATSRARDLGARRLYVSATPSQNTVDFYLHLGCHVTDDVDAALFEREPEDIHLEFDIPGTR
jgi:predicted N-acetyltransferase YhbS